MCSEITYGATNEICSKLSVSPDKINTHICILGPKDYGGLSECEAILKKKFRFSNDEELIIIKPDFINELNLNTDLNDEYHIFSVSLGAFLPTSECKLEKCIEENICTKVKYVNSDDQCSKLEVSTDNLNTHVCIKNPEINSKNCIETNICTNVKYGGTNEKCGKLLSSHNEKTCVKDPLSEGCKETDLCIEAKYVNSFYKCSLLKVSDPNIKYCVKDSNSNGCIEQILNCEQKIKDATEEICDKLETNDNKKKCIKNKDGNNCILIN